ncbi:MAG: TonB-dependent receptor, partial [Muribaculaceae bacterium]|nr:TonB-dependent receptor [Muribaculaceae bacterium]
PRMKRKTNLTIAFAIFACHLNGAKAEGNTFPFLLEKSTGINLVSFTDTIKSLPGVEVLSSSEKTGITSTSPIHTIDSKLISESGITDIADALKRMPGVNLRDYGGAGGLKTVSVRGLGAQHTGITYDGVPLSDLRTGEVDLSKYSLNNLSSLSLSPVDNDEIFIPARSLASASSLSISTIKNPKTAKGFQGNVRMKTGSFGMYNPFFRLGYSNGKKIALSAMGEFFHAKNNYSFSFSNGDYIHKEKRNHSRMNSVNGEINLIYQPTISSSLNAKLYYYDNSRQLPGPVIYYVEDSNEYLHDRNFFGQVKWKSKLSSIFSIMAIGKYNRSSSHYTDEKGIYPGGILNQKFIQHETYTSVSLLCIPVRNWSFDYSADWMLNNLTSNLPSDRKPNRNTILQALSARFSTERVNVIGRLLYSCFINRSHQTEEGEQIIESTNNSFQRLSPSVSISVNPIKQFPLYLRASYKNIFRMPTFNELYFDNYGSVNLKPEVTDQVNLGITYSYPGNRIIKECSIIVDGYYNRVKNKIVAVPYNLFKWAMTNLGDVRIYGVDISLTSEINIAQRQSILVNGSYSYQRAMPHTSPTMLDWKKQVAYTPLNSGSASISWLNPWVSTAIHGTGTSARYTTNSNLPSTRIPGYFEAGLSIFHTFPIKNSRMEIRGELLNIFNKQYQVIARYPMPGRNWTISIKYTF